MHESSMVNGTPPCQNIMFPNPFHFFPSSSPQHPYQYQPLIHLPTTKQKSTTLGEMGASVDMLRAQVLELSKRMEMMESKFSHFEKIVSDDIFLLKNTLSEHSAELLNVRYVAEYACDHSNKTSELTTQQKLCTDELVDAVSRTIHLCRKQMQVQKQSSFKSTVVNAQLGIVRRRLSKIEDFTNEFYEEFESFKSVKEIITGISDHIDECDRDISMISKNKNYNEDGDKENEENEENEVQPIAPCVYDLIDYFSKYDDADDVVGAADPAADAHADDDADDDDFEKLF